MTLGIVLPTFVDQNLRWFVALAVVVIALAVVGTSDVGRLSLTRIWAISGVCFRESIRRRVLWITPLAILGVIVAVQLTQPIDELDAVRQTVKYALFTTGLLVVIATIILACTNLPREIENRVIFTIVTKPTTRLEIVLGKIVGFARVSGTLLIIMGVFTFSYTWLRATRLQAAARARVDALPAGDPSRPSLEHYATEGLLQNRSYVEPTSFEQYAQLPNPGDRYRWILGNEDQAFVFPFDLPPEMFPAPEGAGPETNGGLVIQARIPYRERGGKEASGEAVAVPTPYTHGYPPATEFGGFDLSKRGGAAQSASASVDVLGPDHFNLVPTSELSQSSAPLPHLPSTADPTDGPYTELAAIKPQSLDRLYQLEPERRRIYVRVICYGGFEFGAAPGTVRLYSPLLKRVIEPALGADGKPAWPDFRGREIAGGQQVRAGNDMATSPVGVFEFRNAPEAGGDGKTELEMRLGIEGSGDDASDKESVTTVAVEVLNRKTQKTSPQVQFPIESNRTSFFSVPAEYTAGGDYDVRFRCVGPGHYLVLRGGALQAVTASEPFALNLGKSLLVMWLMSLLVVVVAIFCSTFVSWPIAVVLTAVILMLHWGSTQLADTNTPGIGASVARDMGLRDPSTMKVVSEGVERLSKLLHLVSQVTPDIGQFAATEDIERGVMVAPRVLGESLKVLIAFGVPLTVLAYVFLKRKEVAP